MLKIIQKITFQQVKLYPHPKKNISKTQKHRIKI